jgi:hypothetical protein
MSPAKEVDRKTTRKRHGSAAILKVMRALEGIYFIVLQV